MWKWQQAREASAGFMLSIDSPQRYSSLYLYRNPRHLNWSIKSPLDVFESIWMVLYLPGDFTDRRKHFGFISCRLLHICDYSPFTSEYLQNIHVSTTQTHCCNDESQTLKSILLNVSVMSLNSCMQTIMQKSKSKMAFLIQIMKSWLLREIFIT